MGTLLVNLPLLLGQGSAQREQQSVQLATHWVGQDYQKKKINHRMSTR